MEVRDVANRSLETRQTCNLTGRATGYTWTVYSEYSLICQFVILKFEEYDGLMSLAD